jgi:hypothetical protein
MQQTVEVLSSEVEKANRYVDKVRAEEAARSAGPIAGSENSANLLEADDDIRL